MTQASIFIVRRDIAVLPAALFSCSTEARSLLYDEEPFCPQPLLTEPSRAHNRRSCGLLDFFAHEKPDLRVHHTR